MKSTSTNYENMTEYKKRKAEESYERQKKDVTILKRLGGEIQKSKLLLGKNMLQKKWQNERSSKTLIYIKN